MPELARRRWVLSPVRVAPVPAHPLGRPTSPADDDRLAELLGVAYDAASIDFDPRANYYDEVRAWRGVDRADDEASRVAAVGEDLVGATLISEELGTPSIYELVTHPASRRSGIARILLSGSLAVLASRNAEAVAAWVTQGNTSSERLLGAFGFRPVTPPLLTAAALSLYRAADAATTLKVEGVLATACEALDDGRSLLWVVANRQREDSAVRIRDTDVEVRWITPDDDVLPGVAARAMPISGFGVLSGALRSGRATEP